MSDRLHTILVVDDIPANIQILDEILRDRYRIKAALDGAAALALAEREPPDLVLMDVMMPGMDGMEACRRLKAMPGCENQPVIFVSARGEAQDEEAGLRAGGVDYISKPFHPAVVLARIHTHLELLERNRNLEALVAERTASMRQEMERRLDAMDSLSAAYRLISAVMENFSGAVASVDSQGIITFANRGLGVLLGREPEGLQGCKLCEQLFANHPELGLAVNGAIADRRTASLELKLTSAEGKGILLEARVAPLLSAGSVHGAVFSAQDVTGQRNLQSQLAQASKMATLGQMAIGIAHEINQPLNVIRMASEMIREAAAEGDLDLPFLRERGEKIARMVERAAKIIGHLKTFGRRSAGEFSELNSCRPVYDALELVEERLRLHSVQIDLDLTCEHAFVLGDGPGLEQVFINLILNAADALEESQTPLEDRRIRIAASFHASERSVVYEVRDNGPGIPENKLEQIFEPFYTTKDVGKGTGLGLSILYGIVDSHGGRIHAAAADRGAVFVVRIPAFVREPSEPAGGPARRKEQETGNPGQVYGSANPF